MANEIARLFKSGNRYLRYIGLKDTLFFIVCKYFHLKTLRKIYIADERFYVRTATPDLGIALRCLTGKQYGNIKIDNPSVIIDAGAYIGASSIYFSKKYPNARVFAIEPEKENFEILLKNTDKHKEIIPIKAAVWGKKETRIILNRFTGPWGFTVSISPNLTESTGQQVDCITISSLLDDYHLDHIDILKIDIEGAEKNVLENSGDWIDKVQIITAELHERICSGCENAFNIATKEFLRIEKSSEIITAYRK